MTQKLTIKIVSNDIFAIRLRLLYILIQAVFLENNKDKSQLKQ